MATADNKDVIFAVAFSQAITRLIKAIPNKYITISHLYKQDWIYDVLNILGIYSFNVYSYYSFLGVPSYVEIRLEKISNKSHLLQNCCFGIYIFYD